MPGYVSSGCTVVRPLDLTETTEVMIMNDQPEKKTNRLNKEYPDRYERLCQINNRYRGESYTYTPTEIDGQLQIIESTDSGEEIWSLWKGVLAGIVTTTYALCDAIEQGDPRYVEVEDDYMYVVGLGVALEGDAIEQESAIKNAGSYAGCLSYQEYLSTPHWKRVRKEALKRAGYKCQLCNSESPLHVHHRTYERLGYEEPGDIIALCAKHHKQFHAETKELPN